MGDQDLEVVDVDGLVFFSFCPTLSKKKAFHYHKIKRKPYKFVSFQKNCLPKSTLGNIFTMYY